jgi:hypothetical protein
VPKQLPATIDSTVGESSTEAGDWADPTCGLLESWKPESPK